MKVITNLRRSLLVLLLIVTLVTNIQLAQAGGSASLPILLGAYADISLYQNTDELTLLDNWLTGHGASGLTFAGNFMTITASPDFNVPGELGTAWNAGFTPFVNLMASETWEGSYYDLDCTTTAKIASGLCDDKITLWAQHFKTWAGTSKRAFIAPFPEMNSNWVSYMNGSTSADFKNTFKRIRSIFENIGVPRSAVRWVFAPNGWNDPQAEEHEFEKFYPGDLYTDVVAFSAYNYGGCPYEYKAWETYADAFAPYVTRMVAMAPTKPIFIAQTGSVNVPANPSDPSQNRSEWIRSVFSDMANASNIRAIIYFNLVKSEGTLSCNPADYRFYRADNNTGEQGLIDIMKDSRFGKWAVTDPRWGTVAFTDPAYTFADVLPSHPFSGEPNIWYFNQVNQMYTNGITGGCGTNPLIYCPNSSVTRAQMAVFLERGMHDSTYTPPTGTGLVFADVPLSNPYVNWIEKLSADGITGGCGINPLRYCPNNPVTRAQMAIFLLRAKYGPGYTPPPATGVFSDVPTSTWVASWVEQLAEEGITSGCGGGKYCPNALVTRAQMAVFIVRTFNLP